MPSVQHLREFITERLTAAAEEIFSEFEKTIVRYEEEIDRQRRLLDITWRPEITLRRTDLPQQRVCKEEDEVLTEQQLWNQEEPPQIKEEQEELCSSQDGEQLVVKKEADAFVVAAAGEEQGHREAELHMDWLLSHSSAVAERRYLEGRKKADSGPSRNGDRSQSRDAEDSPLSGSQCNSDTAEKSIKCDVCGKSFKYNSRMKRHYSIHTGLKPYSCDMCGKNFSQRDNLTVHMRIHTGEKPYPCNACGKNFTIRSNLLVHMRIHTGEKPSSCKTCGKMFRCHSHLWRHKKIHTRQKS